MVLYGCGGGSSGGSNNSNVSTAAGNSAPVADAGTDQTAQINDPVTLDGSGSSDVDGDSLTYFWSLITEPDGKTKTK